MPDPLGNFAYTWPYLAALICGYLLGSIPFGLVLTRLAGLGDIRKIGSGNIGATNVLRTGNKALAALTVLLDGGKGAVAVLIAGMYGQDMAVLAGAGAFLGHLFPIWLRLRGGKGVATFLGILLAIAWPVGVLACLTWLLSAVLFRYSSLAALIAAVASPVYAYWLPAWLCPGFSTSGVCAYWVADWQKMQLAAAMALLIFLRHHQNIRRLATGREAKIGGKKDAEATG